LNSIRPPVPVEGEKPVGHGVDDRPGAVESASVSRPVVSPASDAAQRPEPTWAMRSAMSAKKLDRTAVEDPGAARADDDKPRHGRRRRRPGTGSTSAV